MESDQVEADFHGHISWPKQTQDIPDRDAEDLSPATTTSTESEPIESRNPWMQAVWDQASSNELSVPYKYQNVAALIVHWAKYLDEDLHCESESKNLHDLLEKRFKFKSKILKLDSNRDPQRQLRHGLDSLVLENDGPCRSNLLIVYYSGHGIAHPTKGLYITGKESHDPDKLAPPGHGFLPHASWKEAEAMLQGSSADVLTIIDSCYAGSLWKDTVSDKRSWEVLAASNRSDPTAAPGPNSFTRALIDSMQARIDAQPDQLFSVGQLHDDIMKTRNDERSVWRTRHGLNRRFIKLAKLDVSSSSERSPAYTHEAASMTLRLSFSNRTHLEECHVKKLATLISQGAAKADLGVNKIDLLDFSKGKSPSRLFGVIKLYSAVRKAQRLWRGRAARHQLKRQREEEDADEEAMSRSKRTRTDSQVPAVVGAGFEPPSPSPST